MSRAVALVPSNDPILRRVAKPVAMLVPSMRDKIDGMIKIMRTEGGIGIAAPQIGWSARVVVLANGENNLVLVNPVIVDKSEEVVISKEGCLSIPGQEFEVTRHVTVRIRSDVVRYGKLVSVEDDLTGTLAICAQHEIDHLDGKVIWDR